MALIAMELIHQLSFSPVSRCPRSQTPFVNACSRNSISRAIRLHETARHYLWNAARSALRCNPAIRALYRRLKAKGTRGDIAMGHCMRKLLHLVFAVWKSNRSFNDQHFPWEQPAPANAAETTTPADPGPRPSTNDKAVGHKRDVPAEEVVTTAASTVAPTPAPVNPLAPPTPLTHPSIDFAFLRQQVTMERILEHLGLLGNLRGRGQQRRGL
jgi:hypothetical protein